MGKFGKLAAVVGLGAFFLAGCSMDGVPEPVDTPTIAIDKSGQIRLWLVGEFDRAYYDFAELEEMAEGEVEQYNMSRGMESAVSVEDVRQLDSGNVVLEYRFDGWESCTDFTKEEIFYGTVGEAVSRGFTMDVIMKSMKDNNFLMGEQLRQAADQHLIIFDAAVNVYYPGKAAYVSDGAVVNADGSIAPGETEGLVYILLQ